MALRTCPRCGDRVVSSVNFCGACGYLFYEATVPPTVRPIDETIIDENMAPDARVLVVSGSWIATPWDYSSLRYLRFSADMSGMVTYGYGQTIYAKIMCRWDLPAAGLLRLTYLESAPYQHFQGFTPDADNQVKELSYTLTEDDVTGIESIVGWPYKYRWTLELTASPWPNRVEQVLRDELRRVRERFTGSTCPAGVEARFQVPRVFYGHKQNVPREPKRQPEGSA
jgi:hypothetical protein